MRTRKHFGQHFLADPNVIRKIIGAIAPRPGEHFIEIGPGRGAITLPLLAAGVRLDVIEIDHDLARELPAILNAGRDRSEGAGHCTVHDTDALRFDFRTLAAPGERLRLAGNLPYNISTPLLFHLLEQGALFSDLHVMLQKEVGERMTAKHGNRIYGRLTISIALRCTVERLFAIQPGSFRPPPRVDSVFLRLLPHSTPLADERTLAIADRLVTRAFSMRRKRLSNGLRGLLSPAEIRAAGVDDGVRPEDLPPETWLRLAAVNPMLANDAISLSE
ncbi:MAG: 16S rRNA (adenine(1518)-N(6)/adenine(1519)-N(6))-dimethyltransferase RsmA [Gammaproteobacteria bacterium]|nr:16S rRNA (adenine(1518)-N(6)/adenine(1519)-N(6))-dimethyltransferase RsmA [Gammaproteobacteria bacterium]MDH5277133.1 16S rRNA (adenine(1518)-N(6)/adenine(1519)-N(6))-dimethyltransferase RsmA [Gammaproteobacteria bacterium]